MAKILAVDDDPTLLRFVGDYLEGEGHQVVAADRGAKALKQFFRERPDLILLDVMMPGMDGWEVCARVRELADTPIVLLTAKSTEADKLRGFRMGIDDFVVKPFSLAELAARVKAVLGRAGAEPEQEPRLHQVGPISVDSRRREARLNGQPLELTPTEFRLLAVLASRPGEAVSRQELTEAVWRSAPDEGGSALRRYIWFLRQKIENDPQRPTRLVTVRGYGYRLEDQ
jgi:DNA-binding response OmpR family regulator